MFFMKKGGAKKAKYMKQLLVALVIVGLFGAYAIPQQFAFGTDDVRTFTVRFLNTDNSVISEQTVLHAGSAQDPGLGAIQQLDGQELQGWNTEQWRFVETDLDVRPLFLPVQVVKAIEKEEMSMQSMGAPPAEDSPVAPSMAVMALGAANGSPDLTQFVSSVTIKDKNGNVITNNYNYGETYTIDIKYAEKGSGAITQFEYNTNGVLVYTLPSYIQVINPVTDGVILSEIGKKPIGTYTIDLAGNITVKFGEFDNAGNLIPGTNFIDYYDDARFTLSFDSKFVQGAENKKLPFGTDVEIPYNLVYPPPGIDIAKTAVNKTSNETIEYTYTVTAKGTPGAVPPQVISNVKLTDTFSFSIGNMTNVKPAVKSIKYKKNGQPAAGTDITTSVTWPATNKYEYTIPGTMSPGDTVTVTYVLDIKDLIANNPSSAANLSQYDFGANNTVNVTSSAGNDSSSTSTNVKKTLPISKKGTLKGTGNNPRSIEWVSTIGDSTTILNGGVIKDELGNNMTFPADADIKITFYTHPTNNTKLGNKDFTAAELNAVINNTANPRTLTFNVPAEGSTFAGVTVPKIYRAVITYTTDGIPAELDVTVTTNYKNKISFNGIPAEDTVTVQKPTLDSMVQKSGAITGNKITWTVTIGNGTVKLNEQIIKDTLGSGMNFPANLNDINITLYGRPANGTTFANSDRVGNKAFQASAFGTDFSITGNVFTFKVPKAGASTIAGYSGTVPDIYRAVFTYTTDVTLPSIGEKDIVYSNTINYDKTNVTATVTAKAPDIGPMVSKRGTRSTDGKSISWVATVGNGGEVLNGQVITDLLGSNMTFPAADKITVILYTSQTTFNSSNRLGGKDFTGADFGTSFVINNTADPRTITFTVPAEGSTLAGVTGTVPKIYRVEFRYATDITAALPKSYDPVTGFNNKIRYKTQTAEDTIYVDPPLPDLPTTTKTTSGIRQGSDGAYYIDYEVEFTVPAGNQNKQLYVRDILGIYVDGQPDPNNPTFKINNNPANLIDMNVKIYPDPTGALGDPFLTPLNHVIVHGVIGYPNDGRYNYWYLFFGSNEIVHSTDARNKWLWNDTKRVTVSYTIPLSLTEEKSGKTIEQLLKENPSYRLTNSADARREGISLVGEVKVNDTWPIYKEVKVSPTDPTVFDYKVTLNGNGNYKFPLFAGAPAMFYDSFPPGLEYVPGSFYAMCNGKKYTPASGADAGIMQGSGQMAVDLAGLVCTSAAETGWYAKAQKIEIFYQLKVTNVYNPGNSGTEFKNTASVNTTTGPGTSFSNDAKVNYSGQAVTKNMSIAANGGIHAEADIVINPRGIKLAPEGVTENWYKAVDTMSGSLVFFLDSIKIQTQTMVNGKWDGVWKDAPAPQTSEPKLWSINRVSEQVVEFILPDETPIRILYSALITGEPKKETSFRNEISVYGYSDFHQEDRYVVQESTGGAGGNKSKLSLYKEDALTNERLEGAKFEIYVWATDTNAPWNGIDTTAKIEIDNGNGIKNFYYLTDAVYTNGVYLFQHNRITPSFPYVFLIVETQAPEGGYILSAPPDNFKLVSLRGDMIGKESALGLSIQHTADSVFMYNERPQFGTLEISKTVSDSDASPDPEAVFDFVVKMKNENGTYSVVKEISLASGEKIKIEGLPEGVYSVTEVATGFETTYKVNSGSLSSPAKGGATADNLGIEARKTTTVDFFNIYKPTPITVQLTAEKKATGATLANGQFEFAVLDDAGNQVKVKNTAGGQIVFPSIQYTKAGVHTYKIVELSKSGDGWTTDPKEYTATVTVIDDGKGNLKAAVSYEGGNPPTFINTYASSLIDIGVKKVWIDNNNGGGTRPASITFNLLRTGANGVEEKIDTYKMEAPWDSLTHTFTGLKKYETPGVEYKYRVTEDAVTNYSTTDSGIVNGIITFTNTLQPGVTSVEVKKTWVDDNNGNNTRPASIKFNLLRNGVKIGDYTMVSPWTAYTFTGLIKYDGNQKPYVYTVTEDAVANYSTSDTGVVNGSITFTNTLAPGTTEVKVNKVWVDGNNANNTRPTELTFNLLQNGSKIKDYKMKAPWAAYTFTNLVKYDNNQKPYVYTITEDAAANYTTTDTGVVNGSITFTNTLNQGKTSVKVEKVWVDDNNGNGTRPASIQFNLLQNGTKVGEYIMESPWSAYTFENLDKYDGSMAPYVYTVTENPVGGYLTSTAGSAASGFTFTNTLDQVKISVPVNKTWVDNGNGNNTRPASIKFNLLRNGVKIDDYTMVSPWTPYTFPGLDKYDVNKKPYTYTVTEEPVAGYTTASGGSAASGFTFTNTLAAGETSVIVNKTWVDGNNSNGIRPAQITFRLLQNGKEINTQTISDPWDAYTFSGLAKYDDNQAPYVYTVTEDAVTDYLTTDTGVVNGSVTFTNTLAPGTTSVTVNKVWADGDDQYGMRPGSITFNLLQNGTKISEYTMRAPWEAYTFTGLDKYDSNQKPYNYSVTEDPVNWYTTMPGGNAAIGYTFTNTLNDFVPVDLTLSGTKIFTGIGGAALPINTGDFTFTMSPAAGSGFTWNGTNPASVSTGGSISFGTFTFDKPGTYTFTVSEVVPSSAPAGYTYDNAPVTATIVVANDRGALRIASASYSKGGAAAQDIRFNNTYIPGPAVLNLNGTKTLTGVDGDPLMIAADQFMFMLAADGNNPAGVTNTDLPRTVGVLANGNINFGSLSFDRAGTYTFTLSEVNGGKAGYTYDDKTITVTVVVSDNNGKLEASDTYNIVGGSDAIAFANTYIPAPATVNINGNKTLTGAPSQISAGQFVFTLEADSGNPSGVTNIDLPRETGVLAGGAIDFGSLTFNREGVYKFTVSEVAGGASGYTYDNNPVTVTITVTDAGGRLEAATAYSKAGGGTNLAFTNTYTAQGTEATFVATKTAEGRPLAGNDFLFAVYAEDDTEFTDPIAFGTNNAAGNISIVLPFNRVGVYTYKIAEFTESGNGWTVDGRSYTAVVTVVDEGTGTLKATVTYPGGNAAFRNVYNAEPTSVVLEAAKTAVGKELADGQFSFAVYAAGDAGYTNPLATGTNDAGGNITFSEIEYDEVGVYNYAIRETSASGLGWTVDGRTFRAIVTVDDDGLGNLFIANVSYPDGAPAFINTYNAKPVDAAIEAAKTAVGKELAGGQFSFALYNSAGALVETVTNDAAGKISFSSITYTATGVYEYTIRETSAGGDGWKTDASVFRAVVTVTDDGEGNLVAEVTYPEGAAFVNTYTTKPVSVDLAAAKNTVGRVLDKVFEFAVLDASGKPVVTGTNDATGYIAFPAIEYTVPGVYNYTIVETTKSGDGWTVDNSIYSVTVTVEDNGLGQLVADVVYDDGLAIFTNTYEAEPVDVVLEATKTAVGRELNRTFEFDVLDGAGNKVAAGTSDEDGNIAFSKITYVFSENTYMIPVPHTYRIVEKPNTADDGWTADTTEFTAVVTVWDNGKGKLEATVAYPDGDAVFVNSYEAKGVLEFEATKLYFNFAENLVLPDGLFTFIVEELDENLEVAGIVATGTSNADGTVTFDRPSITYILNNSDDQTGTYIYRISEVSEDGVAVGGDGYAVWTANTNPKTIYVRVADEGDGTLSVIPYELDDAIDGIDDLADHLIFSNTYDARGGLDLEGTKLIEGIEDEDIIALLVERGLFDFNFTVIETRLDQESAAGEEPSRPGEYSGTTDETGKIVFDHISYGLDDVGFYKYVITENGPLTNWEIDTAEMTIYVDVVDNGDGTLTPHLYEDEAKELPIDDISAFLKFTNVFTPVIQLVIEKDLVQNVEGNALPEGVEVIDEAKEFQVAIQNLNGDYLTFKKVEGAVIDGELYPVYVYSGVSSVMNDNAMITISATSKAMIIGIPATSENANLTVTETEEEVFGYVLDIAVTYEGDPEKEYLSLGEPDPALETSEAQLVTVQNNYALITISVEVDIDTIRRTSAAFDGNAGVNRVADVYDTGGETINNVNTGDNPDFEMYRYDLNFRSTSNVDADEFYVEDPLTSVNQGHVRLEGLWTPVAWGDVDGVMKVWYKTASGGGGDGRNDDPILSDWSGWKLWAEVSATQRTALSVADLGLDGDYITGLRFEYGEVLVGFTTCVGDVGTNNVASGSNVRYTNDSGKYIDGNTIEHVDSMVAVAMVQPALLAPMINMFSAYAAEGVLHKSEPLEDTPPKGSAGWAPVEGTSYYNPLIAGVSGLKPASYLVSAPGALSSAEIVGSVKAVISKTVNDPASGQALRLYDLDQDTALTRVITPFTEKDRSGYGSIQDGGTFLNIPRFEGLTMRDGQWYDSAGNRVVPRTGDMFALSIWIILSLAMAACVVILVVVGLKKKKKDKDLKPEGGEQK